MSVQYKVIYELLDDVQKALTGMLEPVMVETSHRPRRGAADLHRRQDDDRGLRRPRRRHARGAQGAPAARLAVVCTTGTSSRCAA
jgi:hypothetical protein